ncbi:hypothetical protein AVEN_192847-1 [Araneus ventricosus]|uniref:Uncharacterized protein n=1 Tax=Araneus ventricosus TaxID=182803 RepID=A0A4Y2RU16_ARAVE|nr:hypothetical protein AVEN_192847-1 [Araneus ventricosus]
MNIIEPIWVALQCAVQKRSPPPGTPMDFRTALQDSWCEKPPGYLQTLVDTMPRRVASFLCARPKRYETGVPVFLALQCNIITAAFGDQLFAHNITVLSTWQKKLFVVEAEGLLQSFILRYISKMEGGNDRPQLMTY